MESPDIHRLPGYSLNARMLDALLNASSDNVYLSDRAGRYLYVSPKGARALGFAVADILGKTLSDLSVPSAITARLEAERRHVLTTRQPVQATLAFPTAEGSRTFAYTYSPVLAEDGTAEAVLCVACDVTEREQAQQERDALLQEMRYVTTHAQCLLWHGKVTLYEDGGFYWDTFVFDEAAAQAFLPLTHLPGERYTAAWYRHRLPEGQLKTDRIATEALHSNQPYYRTEFSCQANTGEVRWFDEQIYLESLALPAPGMADFDAHKVAHWRVVGVCTDITERRQADAERQALLTRQRVFLRDVLASVTEGKLRLCDSTNDLPTPLTVASDWLTLSLTEGIRELRHETVRVAEAQGLTQERWYDLITAVGEAGMNAVLHAGGGQGQVCTNGEGTLQVWVVDQGQGIAIEDLPHATLQKGYTTAGTLGHGMKMMLETVDRVWLLTGRQGTTIVLEQDLVAFNFDWF